MGDRLLEIFICLLYTMQTVLGLLLVSTISKTYVRCLNTVRSVTKFRFEAKNSKFDGIVTQVKTSQEAIDWINEVSDPKASHNCWAFRLRDDYQRFSDDGEPGGTAGKPILEALFKHDVHDTVCVVTRYYGGVKLGTGGLQRAYRAAAGGALSEAELEEIHPMSKMLVRLLPNQIGLFYKALGMMDPALVTKTNEEVTPEGKQLVTLWIAEKNMAIFKQVCGQMIQHEVVSSE